MNLISTTVRRDNWIKKLKNNLCSAKKYVNIGKAS